MIIQDDIIINIVILKSNTMSNQDAGKQNPDQSYYQSLEQDENYPEVIQIDRQIDKIQKTLYEKQYLIIKDQFISVDQNTKNYQVIYLTNYRLLVNRNSIISIPYGYIQEVKPFQKFLRVILKTGLYFDFYVQNNQNKLQSTIISAIQYKPFYLNFVNQEQQHSIYDPYAQIQRMKVDCKEYSLFKNQCGKFCSTYPLYFIIPKGIQVQNLNQVKKCRYLQRIPIMSYFNKRSGAGIWRMSQRKHQISQDILKYDISYIRSIPGSSTTIQIEQNSYIKNNYSFQTLFNLKLTYFSLNKYYHSCIQNPIGTKVDFYKILTKWFQEIDKLISLSYHVVNQVSQGNQVFLQQTYALDRISQILVISQIIIDPFFRTLKGLGILIQKEFISYGHPFEDRCGFNKNKQYQTSPIFIQLLQCIHQLIVTHPSCFEYNSALVAKIAYQTYSLKYKNFINKKIHKQKQVTTINCNKSIWNDIIGKRYFYSLHYRKQTSKQLWQIRKKPSIKEYLIWVQYYDLICKMQGEDKQKAQHNPSENLLDIFHKKN